MLQRFVQNLTQRGSYGVIAIVVAIFLVLASTTLSSDASAQVITQTTTRLKAKRANLQTQKVQTQKVQNPKVQAAKVENQQDAFSAGSLALDTETTSLSAVTSRQDDAAVGSAWNEVSTSQISGGSGAARTSWRDSAGTKFGYKFGSFFDSFANEREQSQYLGLDAIADFQAQLMDSLTFRAKALANVTSGYAQSRFGDNLPASGLYVEEAALSLRALDSDFARLYVAGGALSQSVFDSSMFIGRQAFPGLKQTLVFGSAKDFKLRLWAQQTIPTSRNLSTRTVDAEVTPSFLTETIELEVKPNDTFTLKAAVTHFNFNNLPSAIAQESIIYGNTVEEVGPNTSRFKYRFDGLFAQAGLNIDITRRFGWWINGSVIQNAAAPEGFRNAQHIKSGFKIGLPGEVDVVPSLGTYFVEDDAVPGFYNSSSIGHTNRQGYSGAIETFFQRQRFRLRAEFNDADVINFNLNQSRQQSLMIGFETFYEML